uniref:Uncharacterized protein n=1 Tax=Neobodo designis TaxID=312471 RepID=A0A7S1L011_NEODS|mmetsp:Transcript_12233/g.38072  ORF Transcript_12233/g.38072 Transcript_12233/m.38072 type:complete len:505 (+) Transcript_12233:31-1545(+)
MAAMETDLSETQLSMEQQLAELVDEVVFANDQVAKLTECCESLLEYTSQLENDVVLPAFGSLAHVLHDFKRTAAARARGLATSSTSAVSQNPRLAEAFSKMSPPSEATLERSARRALPSNPSPDSVDDAFVALTGFMNVKAELARRLEFCGRTLGEERHESVKPTAHSPRKRSEDSPTREHEGEHRERDPKSNIDALRQQLDLSEQRYGSLSLLHKQEVALLSAQLEEAKGRQRDLEAEVSLLHEHLKNAGESEALYQQAASERSMLQQRVHRLETQLDQNEVDRAAAAESYEALHRAIEASSRGEHSPADPQPIRVLEQEVKHLRRALDDATRALAEQHTEHERTVKDLRRKLAMAQKAAQQRRLELALHGGERDAADTPLHGSESTEGALSESIRKLKQRAAPEQGSRADVSGSITKLRAFELTITALNAELAQLEDKIVTAEARAADERSSLERKVAEERARFRSEQDECDSVLATVSAELEQCMKENAELRARLSASGRR